MKKLSNEFIDKYKNKKNPMSNLGKFVYLRTYSRFLDDEKRREHWWETVKRVVEHQSFLDKNITIKEMENLYDNIFNLRVFPSGRQMWTGGTELSRDIGMQNYNCSATVLDDWDNIYDIMYLAFVGAGIGIRILKEDVKKLPPLRKNLKLHYVEPTDPVKKGNPYTSFIVTEDNQAEIIIGDSKQGIAYAMQLFIDILYKDIFKNITDLTIDFTQIRKQGEKLKRFGGFASGHIAFMNIFKNWETLIMKASENSDGKAVFRPIDVLDLVCLMSQGVLIGGVRRIALMFIFSKNDEEVFHAKDNLYYQKDGEWKINPALKHRQLANNSVFYQEQITRSELHEHILRLKSMGEPGFLNAVAGRIRREDFGISNPCGEVLGGGEKVLCNLQTINMMQFVDENGKIDHEGLFNAAGHASRMGLRVNLQELELPHWDRIKAKENLVGVSLTGYQDFVNAAGLIPYEERYLLTELRYHINKFAKEYVKELGVEKPIFMTSSKPSGTVSLLQTTSTGIEHSFAEYYIRRVRVSADDPIAKTMIDLGYTWHPENGNDPDNPQTVVFEFPVKAPKGKTQKDVSAIEQLENYKLFMQTFVEQNVSVTIKVKEHEWDEVEEWLYNNWDSVVGITLLADIGSNYQLLPYEEISKEKYYELKEALPKRIMVEDIKKYETEYVEPDEVGESCASGVCPIR